jgi:hypothetical protein
MDNSVLQDMFYDFEARELHGSAFEYLQGYSDGMQDCGNRTIDLTIYVQSTILFLMVVVVLVISRRVVSRRVVSRHSYTKQRY